MASITTTYKDFFRVHDDCDPVCPRKESPSDTKDDFQLDPGCLVFPPREEEEEVEEEECCPQEEAEPPQQREPEPCLCREGGRTKCPCVEALRKDLARNFKWPRRQPLTYYAKVFKEYPFMLKMYGEHHTVGVEVEPEDLRSIYMTDYGADKKPVPLERKPGAPPPARVVPPFLYQNPPFRWDTPVEEQIPWWPSDCPLTTDQLLLCERRPRGCRSCGSYA